MLTDEDIEHLFQFVVSLLLINEPFDVDRWERVKNQSPQVFADGAFQLDIHLDEEELILRDTDLEIFREDDLRENINSAFETLRIECQSLTYLQVLFTSTSDQRTVHWMNSSLRRTPSAKTNWQFC